jgi:transcriptional regulator with PAS, ATPase and Fis domain
MSNAWIKEFEGALTICDTTGIIIEMNDKAAKTFEKWGGIKLIGSNLIDCHPEPAKTKLKHLMDNQLKNVYTIEKNGIKKMIFQSPWYSNGEYAGFVELSLEIPLDIPHFVRS